MLRHAFASVDAYENGVVTERARIARDMHDNIGATLLGALRNTDPEVKDARIRESLTDLRAVINQRSHGPESIAATLADLRLETLERLETVGIDLEWIDLNEEFPEAAPRLCHALRSIFREAISNIIRHAEADTATIAIVLRGAMLQIELSDNGRGFDPNSVAGGHGLANIRARMEALSGRFVVEPSPTGTQIQLQIPLNTTTAP